MQMYNYKCFGSNDTSGNLATVISDYSESEIDRQRLAKHLNVPVCVFIDDVIDKTLKVSFFYPDKATPLCLHGALAVAQWFFIHNVSVIQMTIATSASKHIVARKIEQHIFLELVPEFTDIAAKYKNLASNLLELSTDDILNAVVASVGSPKLLVELESKEQLFALTPNLVAVDVWGKQNSINGIYAYYQDQQFIYARNFNHVIAENEDVATGVAASALCAYLERDIIVRQGINLGNDCELNVCYMADKLQLSGLVLATD